MRWDCAETWLLSASESQLSCTVPVSISSSFVACAAASETLPALPNEVFVWRERDPATCTAVVAAAAAVPEEAAGASRKRRRA